MSDKRAFERLVTLCRRTHEQMRMQAARVVDTSLVMRNWLFGWYIVEFERKGAERKALYGKALMEQLSEKLTRELGKGFSKRSLNQYRKFYEVYQKIGQTLSAQSPNEQKYPLISNGYSLLDLDNGELSVVLSQVVSTDSTVWRTLTAELPLS